MCRITDRSWKAMKSSTRISRPGRIISAYAVERSGMAEAVSKMAFGNKLGVKIEHNLDPRDFFAPGWGNLVCEVPDGKVGELAMHLHGHRRGDRQRQPWSTAMCPSLMDEALNAWTKHLWRRYSPPVPA